MPPPFRHLDAISQTISRLPLRHLRRACIAIEGSEEGGASASHTIIYVDTGLIPPCIPVTSISPQNNSLICPFTLHLPHLVSDICHRALSYPSCFRPHGIQNNTVHRGPIDGRPRCTTSINDARVNGTTTFIAVVQASSLEETPLRDVFVLRGRDRIQEDRSRRHCRGGEGPGQRRRESLLAQEHRPDIQMHDGERLIAHTGPLGAEGVVRVIRFSNGAVPKEGNASRNGQVCPS